MSQEERPLLEQGPAAPTIDTNAVVPERADLGPRIEVSDGGPPSGPESADPRTDSSEQERKRRRLKVRSSPSDMTTGTEEHSRQSTSPTRWGRLSLNSPPEPGGGCREVYEEQAEALARIAHEFNIDRDEVLAKAWEVGSVSVVSSLQSSERDGDFGLESDVAGAARVPTPPQRGSSPYTHLLASHGQEMTDQRSVGVFSARSSGAGSSVTARSKRSAGLREERRRRKKVEFTRNYIEKVIVYESDNALMVDIQYKRNRLGWLLLFLALTTDVGLAMFVLWVSLVKGLRPDLTSSVPTYSLILWASVWQIPLYVLLLIVLAMSDLFKLYDFAQLANRSILLLTCGLGVTFMLTTVLQSLAAEYETTRMQIPPQYLPVVNICIWFVLFARWVTRQRVFPQEIVAGLLTFIGYGVTVVPNFVAYSTSKYAGQFYGLQGFLLLVAGVFTLWFLAVERCTAVSPTIVVTIAPSILFQLLGTLLGAVAWISLHRPANLSLADAVAQDNLFSMFHVDYLGYGVCAAVLLFLLQLFYLGAARYLDIMSLAAAVAMKTTLLPYFLYYITCVAGDTPPQFAAVKALWANPNDDGNGPGTCPKVLWNPFLWAGTPLVVVGCICIVVFASVKRQFVQRRLIAAAGKKKPSDAHNRHGREKASLPVDDRGMPIKPRKRPSALDG